MREIPQMILHVSGPYMSSLRSFRRRKERRQFKECWEELEERLSAVQAARLQVC